MNENDGFQGHVSINAKFTDKRDFGYIKINVLPGSIKDNNS